MTTDSTLTVADEFKATAKLFDVPSLVGETCDKCGPTTPAKHVAVKDSFNLFFCTHHARHNSESLTSKGFEIYPSDFAL